MWKLSGEQRSRLHSFASFGRPSAATRRGQGPAQGGRMESTNKSLAPPPPAASDAASGQAFRASTYGHRWSEFDPSLGKTVWRRKSQKKKRRRSATGQELDEVAPLPERRSPSPPRIQLAPLVQRLSRDPKMEVAFLLNEHPQQPKSSDIHAAFRRK